MSGQRVYTAARQALALGPELARGGEAIVHRLSGRPGELAKLYVKGRPEMREKLEHMCARPPDDPARSFGHASIAWPRELLYDAQGRFAGYTMPLIQDAVPILEVFNPRRRARILPGFDRRYLLRTARNLASALSALHEAGYVVGDLNERNALVTPRTLVTLIDTDSFQVQRQKDGQIVVYPCPVGRAEYTPPELQGQAFRGLMRRPEHDNFGLAVLIFQLLMEGNHPFRARWRGQGEPPSLEAKIAGGRFPWAAEPGDDLSPPPGAPSLDHLGPELAELCLACFVDGDESPGLRPGAESWAEALEAAEDQLVSCAQGHVFGGHLRRCPDCGARPARGSNRAAGGTSASGAALTGLSTVTAAARGSLDLGRATAAGILGLPARLLPSKGNARAAMAVPAGALGKAASSPAPTATERLSRASGNAILGIAAAALVALLAVGLQTGLWRLLVSPALAAGATPAGLWALLAGGLAFAAGILVGEAEGNPGAYLDAELARRAGLSTLWAGGGWLAGWLLPALAWATTLGIPLARAILGTVHTAAGALDLGWTVGWVLYGSLLGLLATAEEAAPSTRVVGGLVSGAAGWLMLQLLAQLLGPG